MGCFLACFGLKGKATTKKKKKKQRGKRSPSEEQDLHQSYYVPLDSDHKQNNTSDSNHLNLKENQKEAVIEKIKKKVRFNLNVKAYEPIPDNNDDFGMYLLSDETEKKSMSSFQYEEENVVTSSSLLSTYRYQNCRDSYDDELMMLDDDNDFNFDEIEDDEDDDWMSSPEDDVMMASSEIPEARKWSVRDRSQYVYSVLNPVENLSQWKVVKAKGVSVTPQYMCQKENLMSHQKTNNI